jgi:hypothetical protein
MAIFGMMEDYLGPDRPMPPLVSDMLKVIPRVDGHYMRDEGLQAREVADQLRLLDVAGVEGAFVFTFVSPNSPHTDDPRFDTDMASFSLVKSYAEEETVKEFSRQAARNAKEFGGGDIDPTILAKLSGEVGRHGQTYPEMPWEPKESFRAVAEYYAKH